MSTQTGWRQLDIAVVGGGIGGQAAATSLRRQGHKVTIYEKADFVGEVGASISCAANGTRWLEEWKVNIELGDPVVLEKLISRDWKTGEPVSVYDLSDYKERWGYVSYESGWVMTLDLLILGRSTICFTDNICIKCSWIVLLARRETVYPQS